MRSRFLDKESQPQNGLGQLPLADLPENAAHLVISVVESIPNGYVATYAQVAYRAGLTRKRARFVGKVLRELAPTSTIPWHRVVSSSRVVAPRLGDNQQVKKLKQEGVFFDGNKIPQIFFRWPF